MSLTQVIELDEGYLLIQLMTVFVPCHILSLNRFDNVDSFNGHSLTYLPFTSYLKFVNNLSSCGVKAR